MSHQIDTADIPAVALEDILVPLRAAVAKGQGLALLNGMNETAIREIETVVWEHFADAPQLRLAVALRFRALLEVFAARRLKQLFLNNGFKLIARAAHEAAGQRLNVAYGFKAQRFVLALSSAPATHNNPTLAPMQALAA
ncbi:MAG: hypothetical protein AB7S74_02620 [Hyphomicrobium sp.]